MADCGPTEFFKMADLFITEDLHRPATAHQEDKRNKENYSLWCPPEAYISSVIAVSIYVKSMNVVLT